MRFFDRSCAVLWVALALSGASLGCGGVTPRGTTLVERTVDDESYAEVRRS